MYVGFLLFSKTHKKYPQSPVLSTTKQVLIICLCWSVPAETCMQLYLYYKVKV